jgi:hypothetical protein
MMVDAQSDGQNTLTAEVFIEVTMKSTAVKNSRVRCVCTVIFSQKHCLAPHKSG